jgi:hypothetical protein
MTQDMLEGESAFMEKPESAGRLRELLGLAAKADTGPAKLVSRGPQAAGLTGGDPRPKPRNRRVGSRNPARDPVGIDARA